MCAMLLILATHWKICFSPYECKKKRITVPILRIWYTFPKLFHRWQHFCNSYRGKAILSLAVFCMKYKKYWDVLRGPQHNRKLTTTTTKLFVFLKVFSSAFVRKKAVIWVFLRRQFVIRLSSLLGTPKVPHRLPYGSNKLNYIPPQQLLHAQKLLHREKKCF